MLGALRCLRQDARLHKSSLFRNPQKCLMSRNIMQCLPSAHIDRTVHNTYQAECFDRKIEGFQEPLPQEIHEKLKRIATAFPKSSGYRVIDVGSGVLYQRCACLVLGWFGF